MRTGDDLRHALIALQPAGTYYDRALAPAPWGIELLGREWLAASDGHVLVLVAGAVQDAPRLLPEREAIVRKWFGGPDGDAIDVAALAEFVEFGKGARDCAACKNERDVTCEDCDGSGDEDCECDCGHSHEKTCEACGGAGRMRCKSCADMTDRKPAMLRGHVVNRQLVRLALETVGVSDGMARLSVNAQQVYQLVPDGTEPAWMLLWMPLRSEGRTEPIDFDKPETWRETAAA